MDTITGFPLAKFRLGLWRLGNASFVLRSRGAPVVAIDPVLRIPPPAGAAVPPFPPSDFRADVVVISGSRPERFDIGTVNKSPAKAQAFFAGPAEVVARLESIGIPSSRLGLMEPGKRMEFEGLVVEGRPCAAGREGVSILATAAESGTRFYFASDPYHEVGAGMADILSVPLFPGEGSAGAKFTAHVRPRWSIPCPLGAREAGEKDVMEFAMEAQGAGVGEAVARLDPVHPMLLAADGTWVRATGNLSMAWQCGKSLPDAGLPPGYKSRKFKEADIPALAGIYMKTYGVFYDENWFRKSIMGSYIYSPDRCFVVEHGGKPVAVVLAWEEEKVKDIGRGVQKYLATDPGHQHRGLGRACTAMVMAYFKKDGRREVRLEMEDFRVRALRAYLGLGFETVEDTEEAKRRWENVRAELEATG
jgi:mycothiol synthase